MDANHAHCLSGCLFNYFQKDDPKRREEKKNDPWSWISHDKFVRVAGRKDFCRPFINSEQGYDKQLENKKKKRTKIESSIYIEI